MSALNPQAVLEDRSSDRTPIPFIVGLVVCGLCGLLALSYYLFTGGVQTTLVSGLLALPTVVVLVGLVLLVDRLEPEPRVMLLLAFGWGAGVAIVGSFLINTVGGALLVPVYGPDTADLLAGSVIAPVVEESFKGSLLLVLLLFRRFEIDGPTDGVVYAALCGLGFAFVENILYYQGGLIEHANIASTVLVRGVIAPLGHPLYTAMTGLGVAHAAKNRGAGRVLTVVLGWLAAVLLHAMWNFLIGFGGGGMAVAYFVELGVLVAVIAVLVGDRRRLVALIGAHLPPYIPSGLVQPADLQMLGSLRGRKQARGWARRTSGLVGARAMADYQLAATELALLHDHAMRATIPVEKFHARRNAILGLMRVARDAFFRRAPQVSAAPWTPRGQQSGFFRPVSEVETSRLPDYQPTARIARADLPGGGVPPGPGTPPPGTPAPGPTVQSGQEGRPPAQGAPPQNAPGQHPPAQNPPAQQPPAQNPPAQNPAQSGPGQQGGIRPYSPPAQPPQWPNANNR